MAPQKGAGITPASVIFRLIMIIIIYINKCNQLMHRHVVAVMSRDRNGLHSRTSRLRFIEDREIAHAFRPIRWFSSTATLFLLDRKHCGIALPVRRIELHFARRSAPTFIILESPLRAGTPASDEKNQESPLWTSDETAAKTRCYSSRYL